MADIFISYSRSNGDRVAEISNAFEQGGHSLWWDRRLLSGIDYGTVIEREIAAAACVVVAWSTTARQSLWVRAEANEALDSGKLVQLRLDEAKLPLPFTMLHFLDFSRWSGAVQGAPWSELDTRVRRMIAGEGVEGPEEEAPYREAGPSRPALQGLEKTALLGWASIAVAALIAVAVILAARGSIPPGLFGGIALVGLAAAAGLLALTAFTLLRVSTASRR